MSGKTPMQVRLKNSRMKSSRRSNGRLLTLLIPNQYFLSPVPL